MTNELKDRLKEIFDAERWKFSGTSEMHIAIEKDHNTSLDRIEKDVREYIKDLELDKESAAMRIAECEAEIERLEDEEEKALEERHAWEEKATELACRVGGYFKEDVGEHTSCNCPVNNAIEILKNKERHGVVVKVPKVVKPVEDAYGDAEVPGGLYTWMICPDCEHVLHPGDKPPAFNYCPGCGAKLDWAEIKGE